MTASQPLRVLDQTSEVPPRVQTLPPREVRRVLLINPMSVPETYHLPTVLGRGAFVESPLGLGYLKSALAAARPEIECRIIDVNALAIRRILDTERVDMDAIWADLEARIAAFAPDLIGLSCMFINIASMCHRTVAVARRAAPAAITVLGGHYASSMANVALTDDNVDFVVLSEGERTLVSLIGALTEGVEPSSVVEGLSYRQGASIARVEKRGMVHDLEELPWPDRSDFDMDLYSGYASGGQGARMASLTSSRGCPFRCTFCQSTEFWGREIRYRDPKQVVAEMRFLQERWGISMFVLNDDNPTYRRRDILALCNEMKRQNLRAGWICGGGIQVTTLKPDVIQAMVETGVVYFNLAIESGIESTLRRIQKPLVTGIAEEVIAELRKYDHVVVDSHFIVGFHFETMEDVETNLAYAAGLDLDWRNFYAFTPLPGTHDFEECVERGYIKGWGGWRDRFAFVELTTEHFTAAELRRRMFKTDLAHNVLKNRNMKLRPHVALHQLEGLIKSTPDNAIAHYARGEVLLSLGLKADAIEAFQTGAAHAEASKSSNEDVALRTEGVYGLAAASKEGWSNQPDDLDRRVQTRFGGRIVEEAPIRWVDCVEELGLDFEAAIRRAQAERSGSTRSIFDSSASNPSS